MDGWMNGGTCKDRQKERRKDGWMNGGKDGQKEGKKGEKGRGHKD